MPNDALERFAAALFQPDDVVEVRLLPSRQSFWPAASALPSLAGQLATLNTSQNVYVGANPRKAFGGKIAADVAIARSAFVDFDGIATYDARQRIATAGLPWPTVIVASGHGCHCYWRLAEPMTDLAKWTELQKSLISRLNSDKSIHDPPRIMRLPGFINLKPPAAPCELIECEPLRRYSLADLSPGNLVGMIHPVADNRADRCRAYLQKLPDSIQGENGSRVMLQAACECRRFGLDQSETWDTLQWFNQTKCQPAWSDKEIRHKIESAEKHVCEVGQRLDGRPASAQAKEVAECGPILRRFSDIPREQVQWLWPNRIGLKKLNLIFGDPGLGKSFISLDFAARVSTGRPWPDGSPCPKGDIILIGAEDDAGDTIAPRLDAAGADTSRIFDFSGIMHLGEGGKKVERSLTLDCIPEIEQAIKSVGDCRLVVIDPVSAYLGENDSHKNAEIRAMLMPLKEIAEKYKVAFVLINHMAKAGGSRAMYRAMGSLAFVAACRSAWMVSADPDKRDRRFLLPAKNNIGDDKTGFAYSIVNGAVTWEPQAIELTADDALRQSEPEQGKPGPDPELRNEAKDFLREYLSQGPKPAATVIREAKAAGIAQKTLERAKKELGIKTHKQGMMNGWFWSIPFAAGESLIAEVHAAMATPSTN